MKKFVGDVFPKLRNAARVFGHRQDDGVASGIGGSAFLVPLTGALVALVAMWGVLAVWAFRTPFVLLALCLHRLVMGVHHPANAGLLPEPRVGGGIPEDGAD